MPRTDFVHDIDGFAFSNTWDMHPEDFDQIRGLLQGAATALCFLPVVNPLTFLVPPGPPISPFIIGGIVTQAIASANTGTFGLCGGMAFAAADYHALRWLPQRGEFGGVPRHPDWTTPQGTALRSYIWRRLLDSLQADGAVKTLLYMAVFHQIFPFSTLGNAQWLRDRSHEDFLTIKAAIDRGQPCPIGLVGTTTNPMNNHQVLVTGYDDPGNGTCTLYVNESNAPNVESSIFFDFSGARPAVESAYANTGGVHPVKGPLQGFFTTAYRSVLPQPSIVLSSGLTPTPSGSVMTGSTVRFDMRARNAGFGDTPPLKLYVAGRAAGGAENVDAGGEPRALTLSADAERAFSISSNMHGHPGAQQFFTSSSVEVNGHQAWRLIPSSTVVPVAGGPQPFVNLQVTSVPAAWASMGGVITSSPTAITGTDGRLNVFAIGSEGNLWTVRQSAPSNGWAGWAMAGPAVPSRLQGRPMPVIDNQGKIWVYARGSDATVWRIQQNTANGAFASWESLGGRVTFDPSPTFNLDGRAEVFARQADGTLSHRWIQPLGWWPPLGGWESRHGDGSDSPAAARDAAGCIHLFARFSDNSIRHCHQTSPGGGWTDWEAFGSSLTAAPSVGINADGRLEVFCVAGGTVWQRWQGAPNGPWSGWISMGFTPAADARVAVVRNSFGGCEIAVRARDGSVGTAGYRPGLPWTPWTSLGGTLDGDPTIALNADGRAEVLIRSADASLQHRWQVTPGGAWNS